ncbi:hypothetical protein [Solicola gregarius]|uniref:Uncharacterized protein n=1 Tax=Solicola gregarius TaxID=2908642 RepID=A0AA46TDZ6_9ACTN|nr:hypothetical protein [Solicola gregarius]UYM03445.1 hypothetical protein L0C25_12850 [Solicola gregarius]
MTGLHQPIVTASAIGPVAVCATCHARYVGDMCGAHAWRHATTTEHRVVVRTEKLITFDARPLPLSTETETVTAPTADHTPDARQAATSRATHEPWPNQPPERPCVACGTGSQAWRGIQDLAGRSCCTRCRHPIVETDAS